MAPGAKPEEPLRTPDMVFRHPSGAGYVMAWIEHGIVRGQVQPISLRLVAPNGLSRKVLDAVPWAEITSLPRPRFAEIADRDLAHAIEAGSLAPEAVPTARVVVMRDRRAGRGRGGRPALTREYLRQVAETYTEAWRQGGNPTKAVQTRFGIAYSTAAEHVGRARKARLLPRTDPGQAKGKNPTSKAKGEQR